MLAMIMQTGTLDLTTVLIIVALMGIGFILGLIPIIGAIYIVLVAIAFALTGFDEIGIVLIGSAVWIGALVGAMVTFLMGGGIWYSPNLIVSTLVILIFLFLFLINFFGMSVESVLIGIGAAGGLGAGCAVAIVKGPEINEKLDCKCVTVKGKKLCMGNLNKCKENI